MCWWMDIGEENNITFEIKLSTIQKLLQNQYGAELPTNIRSALSIPWGDGCYLGGYL